MAVYEVLFSIRHVVVRVGVSPGAVLKVHSQPREEVAILRTTCLLTKIESALSRFHRCYFGVFLGGFSKFSRGSNLFYILPYSGSHLLVKSRYRKRPGITGNYFELRDSCPDIVRCPKVPLQYFRINHNRIWKYCAITVCEQYKGITMMCRSRWV